MLTIENFGTLTIIEDYLLNKFDKNPKSKKYGKEHFYERFAKSIYFFITKIYFYKEMS